MGLPAPRAISPRSASHRAGSSRFVVSAALRFVPGHRALLPVKCPVCVLLLWGSGTIYMADKYFQSDRSMSMRIMIVARTNQWIHEPENNDITLSTEPWAQSPTYFIPALLLTSSMTLENVFNFSDLFFFTPSDELVPKILPILDKRKLEEKYVRKDYGNKV